MSQHLDVLSDSAPVFCGHVGRVQQRTVLQHAVDDPLVVFTHSERDKHEPVRFYSFTEELSVKCAETKQKTWLQF